VPFLDGKYPYVGKVGDTVSFEDAQKAARLCALNILGHLQVALGDLDRVTACVRVGGFVNAVPNFRDHPKVINGASDLIVEVFGEAGRHARTAVGVGSLPNNVAVEVDAIFEAA
jgi:enamine deaminase RidA (YjgF/YER057c/UK114 family)